MGLKYKESIIYARNPKYMLEFQIICTKFKIYARILDYMHEILNIARNLVLYDTEFYI